MTQGILLREKVKREILFTAADQKEHTRSFFVQTLKGTFSKNTVYKYLSELVNEKFLKGKLDEALKPKLLITKKGLQQVDKEIKKEKNLEVSEWLAKLHPVEAKVHLERAWDRIMELNRIVNVRDQRIRDDMTDSIIWLRTIRKLNQLSGKELQTWDVKKYREDLRREFKRREAARIEYNKRYPERPEKLLQNPIKNHDEYAKGFEEYYKEFSRKESEKTRLKKKRVQRE